MKLIALTLVAFVTFPLAVTTADITYSDGTFNSTDWNYTNVNSGNGETVVANQQNDGPPQNEYRRVTHTVTNGTTSYVQGRHLNSIWEYDPAVFGGIDSMSVQYKVQKPGTDPYYFGIGFLVEQDGNYFYDVNHYLGLPPSHVSWHTISFTSLQTDFQAMDGTGANLDFSNTAAPIHLGLLTANSFDPHHPTGFSSSYNIDDFEIRVSSNVPEPGTSLFLTLPIMAWIVRRKNRRCLAPVGSATT